MGSVSNQCIVVLYKETLVTDIIRKAYSVGYIRVFSVYLHMYIDSNRMSKN